MRIQQLELLSFGPFTNTTLDLSGGRQGLHIIYGPNEAGKSTTLRAIFGLLFGIETRSTDDFVHEKKNLRIGGTLLTHAGQSFRFHRRKGRKDTILDPATGAPLPNRQLVSLLNSLDEDSFRRIYGIDHIELEEGGRSMARLEGDFGALLSSASVVGPQLRELREQLQQDADTLFKSRGKSTITELLRQYKELKSRHKQCRLAKRTWEQQQADLADAQHRFEEVRRQQQELDASRSRLERIRTGWPLLAQYQSLSRQIEELGDAHILPETYSPETRNEVQTQLHTVTAGIERVRDRMEGPDSLQQQIDQIHIPDGLLDVAQEIDDLTDDSAITSKALADRTRLEAECERHRSDLDGWLKKLAPDATLADADRFLPTAEQEALIDELGREEQSVRSRPPSLRAQCEQAQHSLNSLQTQLRELGEPVSADDLEQALTSAEALQATQSDARNLQQSVASRERILQRDFDALPLWKGSLDDLLSAEVPLQETVTRYSDDLAAASNRETELRKKNEELQQQLARARRSLEELQQGGAVPTEDELQSHRAQRNELWAQARGAWLSDDPKLSKPEAAALAETVTQSLQRADETADRLRREADRVARRAAAIAEEADYTRRLESTQQQLTAAQQRSEELQQQWVAEWKAVGIPSPLTPREMLNWLSKVQDLRTLRDQVQADNGKLETSRSRITEAAGKLAAALHAVGVDDTTDSDLDSLIATGKATLKRLQQHDISWRELKRDAGKAEEQLGALRQQLADAAKNLQEFEQRWAAAITPLGCRPEQSMAEVKARLDTVREIERLRSSLREKESRISEIQAHAEAFAAKARRLAERFLPNADRPAAEATKLLSAALEAAKQGQQKRETLQADLRKTKDELQELEHRRDALESQLQKFCDDAKVQNPASLPEVEKQSDRLRSLLSQRENVEQQLLQQTQGQSVADFEKEVAGVDRDQVPGQLEEIKQQAEQLKTERDQAVQRVKDLERSQRQTENADHAAVLDQQALSTLASMHSEAERYMQIRLAAALLDCHLEARHGEHGAPVLQKASDLFSTLTCGEFRGLQVDFEDDKTVLVGVRQDGEIVSVDGMSTGTQCQLFLALRLAYVEDRAAEADPMPFIADDILVQFDDQRAAAALQALGQFSQHTQVLFLTHHQHLVELATSSVPTDQLFIHDLHHGRSQQQSASGKSR